ncbi:hypothetical protein V1281_001902 [Nitrobacteraceae bacterium AZCC 2161]
MPAPFARLISDYNDLVLALRERFDDMEMTRLEIDEQSGLQSGYSGKTLSLTPKKHFGMVSLGPTLGSAGCKLLLVEDPIQTERILARRQVRQRPVRKPAMIESASNV